MTSLRNPSTTSCIVTNWSRPLLIPSELLNLIHNFSKTIPIRFDIYPKTHVKTLENGKIIQHKSGNNKNGYCGIISSTPFVPNNPAKNYFNFILKIPKGSRILGIGLISGDLKVVKNLFSKKLVDIYDEARRSSKCVYMLYNDDNFQAYLNGKGIIDVYTNEPVLHTKNKTDELTIKMILDCDLLTFWKCNNQNIRDCSKILKDIKLAKDVLNMTFYIAIRSLSSHKLIGCTVIDE